MAEVQQRVLIASLLAAVVVAPETQARKFYPDDPLQKTPPPRRVENPYKRKLNEYYDFFLNTFFAPGEKHASGKIVPAGDVNTLGEVLDGPWYTNRHGVKRMSIEELRRGPGVDNAPSTEKPWRVIGAKSEGITPGFTIEDKRGRKYLVKVDPLDYPEIATAADVIGSKLFHALGYHVPENYIAHFRREDLVIDPKAKFIDNYGKDRMMKSRDLDEILMDVPRNSDGKFRGVASYFIADGIGPFRFHGVRRDDPNDIVPHEHRRDLRGLFVFAAWLGHNDIKSLNTLDSLVKDGDLQYIRHYLIDFGAAFGSDSFTAKSPRAGNEYLFAWKPSIIDFFSLGLYVPKWQRANYPSIRGVGRFEWKVFDPEKWLPNYPNPAFMNRLPDDEYWAARQVMRFTTEEIRAMMETGQFTDPKAVEWLTRCLIERSDKIGRAYLVKILALENFRVTITDGSKSQLEFDDVAVEHGIEKARTYVYQWFRFDNESERKTPLRGETSSSVPEEFREQPADSYYAVGIHAGDPAKEVVVYLRKSGSGQPEIVGVERRWPTSSAGERLSYSFGDTLRNDSDRRTRAAGSSVP